MLREKSQRRLCRALFVLGCVLPTLAFAGFTANRLSPGYTESIVDRVEESLGVAITCEHLTTPRPGSYEFRGIEVADRTTGEQLTQLSDARLTEQDDGAWRLSVADCRTATANAAAALAARLLESDVLAEVRFNRLSIGGDESLDKVTLSVRDLEDSRRELVLTTAGGAKARVELDAGVWRLDADTAGLALPAAWLPSNPLPTGELLRFTGSMRAECYRGRDAVRGVAVGRFTASNLRLAKIDATRGELADCDLRWTNERVEHLTGRLTLRDGQMTRSLVEGAATWLKLKPYEHLLSLYNDSPEPLAAFLYTQIACEIELGASGLVLVARNDRFEGQNRSGLVAHAIVEHEGRPLLGEPTAPSLSAQSLVQAWFSEQTAELPASTEAIDMARRLPGSIYR